MLYSAVQSCPTLQPHGLQPTRLLCPWDSPGKNTRVGSLSLLQGIFLTQGLNPGLPHCRWILYQLSHQGSPSCDINGTTQYVVVTSLVAQTVNRLPAMRETQLPSLGREGPLEKKIGTHSSILAWRIPWTEKLGGLHCVQRVTQRVGHH